MEKNVYSDYLCVIGLGPFKGFFVFVFVLTWIFLYFPNFPTVKMFNQKIKQIFSLQIVFFFLDVKLCFQLHLMDCI